MSKLDSKKIISQLKAMAKDFSPMEEVHNIGYVISSADGIVQVSGLKQVKYYECVLFTQYDIYGIVQDICETHINVAVLSNKNISAQAHVVGTGKTMSIPVGQTILGRVVDIFGKPLDDKKTAIVEEAEMPLEADAPTVFERKPVTEPLSTGVKTIDAFLPIGRGQREMIIGDRSTGKTSLAVDMIINQKHTHNTDSPVYCIYVSIGQKASKIAHVKQILEDNDAMHYTTILATKADDPAICQVLAPYAGCAIGEFFRNQGKHVLIIYDDLTKHAVAHRHISLLLRRSTGREAYPGDTFYLHSRLLERAAQLNDNLGGGSLTAIPIVAIQDGNYAAYVPTNIWSITDGQIVLDSKRFLAGQRPAIDIGLSVSRVGSAAQPQAMKQTMKLKLLLAQYEEYKAFAKYGSELDNSTLMILQAGENLMEILKQRNQHVCNLPEEVVIFHACLNGHINSLKSEQVNIFQQKIKDALGSKYSNVSEYITKHHSIDEQTLKQVNTMIAQVLAKL